jgi:hypothetical protein
MAPVAAEDAERPTTHTRMRNHMHVTRASRFGPSLRSGVMAAGLALFAAAPLAAQANGSAGQDSSLQALRKELQEVTQTFIQLRGQALEDSAIHEEQLKLQQEIQQKMNEIDASTSSRTDRMNAIKQSFQEAQQKQDTAKITALMNEYQDLSQKLQQTQEQAMQDQAIAAQLDTFRTDVIQRMNAIDPRADSLIARLQTLQAKLSGGGSGETGRN